MRKIKQVQFVDKDDLGFELIVVTEDGLLYFGATDWADNQMRWRALEGPPEGNPFKKERDPAQQIVDDNKRRFN